MSNGWSHNCSLCASAPQKLVGDLLLFAGKFCGNLGRNCAGCYTFRTHKIKAQEFRGNFGTFFVNKFLTQTKYFAPTCSADAPQKLQEEKNAYFCMKTSGRQVKLLKGDKSASQSSMELYYPWNSGLRIMRSPYRIQNPSNPENTPQNTP